MRKISFGEDKKVNEWHPEITKVLIDKSIRPKDYRSEKEGTDISCDKHGMSRKTFAIMYKNIKEHGKVVCNKCSREISTKKAMKTNLERYGGQPAQNPGVLAKMKATNLERYGVEFIVEADDFQDKSKKTNLERYGVEYGLMDPKIRAKGTKTMEEKYGEGVTHYFKSEENYTKWKAGNIEKYGVEFPIQNEEIRQRFTDTMVDRYGVEHALQHDDFIDKARDTTLERFGVEHATQNYDIYIKACESKNIIPVTEKMFNLMNDKDSLSKYLDEVAQELGELPSIMKVSSLVNYSPTRVAQIIRKLELEDKIHYLAGESYGEHEIIEFLKGHGIKSKHRYTSLGNEIDIYIEDHDVGIEFNGLFWHSDLYKKKKYHYNKYKEYNDIGTRLIQIYEDEWADDETREILKSIILSACGKVDDRSVKYARKLRLLELVNVKGVVDFYEENHLQGFRSASHHIALMDGEEIIEMMSFGYAYFGNRVNKKKYQYELIRHCTKLNYSVVGGKERIFKHFISKYPYDNDYEFHIVSYCDLDKFNGNSYAQLGFIPNTHSIQMWGIDENYTRRVNRNPSNNDYFKGLPKIYGAGNVTFVY